MPQKDLRYSRQVILPEIGEAGQRKISAARVLVVGAGGLGCPALQYLAAAGVGTIGIVDPDTVDISNLHRQILYKTDDQGRFKAEAAKERLLQMNPEISVTAYPVALSAQNAVDFFSGYDIVIDGTDNFPTKFLINDAAVKTGKPLVYGAIQGFDGQVSVFDASKGPCYRCLYSEPPPGLIQNCAEAGVIGAIAAVAGTVQAMETIKIIVGHPSFQPLTGRVWMIDMRGMDVQILKIPKKPGCAACSKPPAEIVLRSAAPACAVNAPEEVECHVAAGMTNAVLIDVREQGEWDAGHIDGARLLPLSVLQKNAQAFTPPGDGKICILYCQRGMRSKQAAAILIGAGFGNVLSLAGGYEAWRRNDAAS